MSFGLWGKLLAIAHVNLRATIWQRIPTRRCVRLAGIAAVTADRATIINGTDNSWSSVSFQSALLSRLIYRLFHLSLKPFLWGAELHGPALSVNDISTSNSEPRKHFIGSELDHAVQPLNGRMAPVTPALPVDRNCDGHRADWQWLYEKSSHTSSNHLHLKSHGPSCMSLLKSSVSKMIHRDLDTNHCCHYNKVCAIASSPRRIAASTWPGCDRKSSGAKRINRRTFMPERSGSKE
jgi:hypothetical protein